MLRTTIQIWFKRAFQLSAPHLGLETSGNRNQECRAQPFRAYITVRARKFTPMIQGRTSNISSLLPATTKNAQHASKLQHQLERKYCRKPWHGSQLLSNQKYSLQHLQPFSWQTTFPANCFHISQTRRSLSRSYSRSLTHIHITKPWPVHKTLHTHTSMIHVSSLPSLNKPIATAARKQWSPNTWTSSPRLVPYSLMKTKSWLYICSAQTNVESPWNLWGGHSVRWQKSELKERRQRETKQQNITNKQKINCLKKKKNGGHGEMELL